MRKVDRVRVHRRDQVQAPQDQFHFSLGSESYKSLSHRSRTSPVVVTGTFYFYFWLVSTYFIRPGGYAFFYFLSVSCVSTHTSITPSRDVACVLSI